MAEPLAVAVVGGGRVFEKLYLPTLKGSREWRLVAVCEPLAERARVLRERTGLHVVSALSEISERLDAAFVLTPPAAHEAISVDALARGIHVLVEKPMALETRAAIEMSQAAHQAKRVLWVGFNRRFMATYRRFRTRPPVAAAGVAWSGRLITDPRGWGPITGRPLDVLADAGSHLADLLPWMLGSRVHGVEGAKYTKQTATEAIIQFRLVCANGRTVDCEAGHGVRYEEELVADGDRRIWLASPSSILAARIPLRFLRRAHAFAGEADALLRAGTGRQSPARASVAEMLRVFGARVRGAARGEHDPDAEAGVRAVAVIEACHASLEANGAVKPVAAHESPLP